LYRDVQCFLFLCDRNFRGPRRKFASRKKVNRYAPKTGGQGGDVLLGTFLFAHDRNFVYIFCKERTFLLSKNCKGKITPPVFFGFFQKDCVGYYAKKEDASQIVYSAKSVKFNTQLLENNTIIYINWYWY